MPNRQLRLENLEDRLLLAFDLTIYDDLVEDPRSQFGQYGQHAVTEDSVYYVDTDLQNGSELHRLDLATLESSLVADLAPGFGDSSPGDFVFVGDSQIAFTAYDPVHGRELRLLDTTSNSISTIDFTPGNSSSFPDVRLVVGEKLIVVATDPVRGEALRIVDVADQTSETIEIDGQVDAGLYNFHAYGDTLFFTATTEQEGQEPRLLDLSSLELSTIDLNPGFESSFARDVVLADNLVYFVAGGFDSGRIHQVDLVDGSLSVNDQIPLPVRFSTMYPSGNKVFFIADDEAHGRELRALDSDLQFTTIDIVPGSASSGPSDIVSTDGTLFLSAVDADHGREVWSVDTVTYDATVHDLNPGPGNSNTFNYFSIEDNRLGAFSYGVPNARLWVIDPVSAEVDVFEFDRGGSVPYAREANGKYFIAIDNESIEVFDPVLNTLSEIDIAIAGSGRPPSGDFVATDEQILVTAVNAAGEFRIHAISTLDNTVTESVEVYAGADSTLVRYFGNLTEIEDRVFFGGLRIAEIGTNEMSAVNNADGTLDDSGFHAAIGNDVLFEAWDPEHGSELRIFNTVDDSLTTVDINPGPDSSSPTFRNENFFAIGTRLFFAASDPEWGQELRIYDTADDSLVTVDINPGSGSSDPVLREGQSLFDGERLYFPATSTAIGREIHFYDITDGSVGAIDVNLDGDSVAGFEEELVAAEGKLYFSAFDWIHGREIRVFDPVDNSVATFDVNPGVESSNPEGIGAQGSSVYFIANDRGNGAETRVVDATTDELSTFDIYPGPNSARPSSLKSVGDHLFLSADSPGLSQTLHRIDFSSLEVETWEASPSLSRFSPGLVDVEGDLYFNAHDEDLGWELHVFDTIDESFSVIDVNPGPDSSNPSGLVFDDQRLYFSVGQFGGEIGVVELEDRSSIVIDLVQGADSSSAGIYNGILVGESGVYFLAQKPGFGLELFGLQYTPTVLDFDNDGSLGCHDVNSISTAVANRSGDLSFDVNGDQQIDKLDLDRWLVLAGRETLGEGRRFPVGDANLDGVTDVSDFNVWNSNRLTENSSWCSGDFNADGFVDVSDFNLWNSSQFVPPAGDSPASDSATLRSVVPFVFEAPTSSRHTQTSQHLQLIDRVFADDETSGRAIHHGRLVNAAPFRQRKFF